MQACLLSGYPTKQQFSSLLNVQRKRNAGLEKAMMMIIATKYMLSILLGSDCSCRDTLADLNPWTQSVRCLSPSAKACDTIGLVQSRSHKPTNWKRVLHRPQVLISNWKRNLGFPHRPPVRGRERAFGLGNQKTFRGTIIVGFKRNTSFPVAWTETGNAVFEIYCTDALVSYFISYEGIGARPILYRRLKANDGWLQQRVFVSHLAISLLHELYPKKLFLVIILRCCLFKFHSGSTF